MKKITGGFLFISAALGLAACGSGATNSNVAVNGNKVANNTAVVVNDNAAVTNANTVVVNGSSNAVSNASPSLSDDDKKFFNDAAQGGMTEVKMGELAEKNGVNADVKAFGKKMTEDHGKAGDDLKALASKKGVVLPADINTEQKAAYDKLAKLSGADFDKEYVKMMVDDHDKDSGAFKKQSDNGKDSDLKAFAAKYSPIVDSHLKTIKDIQSKMK